MAVILDTDTLTLFLKPEIPPPNDPSTGKPITYAAARLSMLIDGLAKQHARILIPATVWAEFLVTAGDEGPIFQAKLRERASVEIVPFDAISAVEAAIDQRKALEVGNKKLALAGSRQCVKADRQIVAIGKTRNVDAIYTADADIVKIGASMGVNVVPLWDLPIPKEDEKPPLLAIMDAAPSSNELEQPSAQSPASVTPKASLPLPVHPSGLHDVPAPQQQGSSPAAPPLPPSKK